MKNACSNIIFFVVVILPFMLFSYQNCSQLQSQQEIEKLASQINFFDTEPLLLKDLNKIQYNGGSNCNEITDELVFYHPDWNLCALSQNTCESEFLQEQGYHIATPENCQRAVDEEDMALNSFTRKSPNELGYVGDQNSYCTQIITDHVNLFTRVCAQATDGCEANFLRKRKFIADKFKLCE